jgi:pyruvate dehydrogenase E2 component (dihydrolipoamide acetyltransferase)
VAPGGLHRVWLRQGNGAPSVLIHGFGAELSSWRPLLTASGDVGPVLAIDLPGHGKSPMTEGADLPALVGAVEETLAEENVASLHLLGHSLGGAVATLLATRGAVEVRSLLLLDPAGLGPEINGAFIAGFLRAESEASLVPWLRELVSKEANLPQGLAAATLRQRRDGRLVAAQARIAATVLPDGTQAFSTRALFETLSIPAKIVFGTDDRIIPARHALGLPGTVALHLFPGTGHTPQLERRSEVARLWVELLRAAG